jgi:hypothetical protein
MIQSVPSFTAKLAKYRPRIVCFVGKGIWVIVEAAFRKQVEATSQDPSRKDNIANVESRTDTDDAGEDPLLPPSTPRKSSTNRRSKNRPKATSNSFDYGLQPYKLVYTDVTCKSLGVVKYCTIIYTKKQQLASSKNKPSEMSHLSMILSYRREDVV